MVKGIGFNINGYEDAQQIVSGYNERNESWMRDVVAKATRKPAYADGLGFGELIRDARRIHGVAQKMLKRRDSSETLRPVTARAPAGQSRVQRQMTFDFK